MKILLAEDDKICQNAIISHAKKFGVDLHVANNGVEAFELCKANTDYSLILMDLGMDPMDGYTATKEIRALTHGAGYKIIALTGDALDEEPMLKLGFNGTMKKPVTKSVFENLIKSLN